MSGQPPRDIPGFYYDSDKQRYFAIQRGISAESSYSLSSVKRRKLEDAQKEKDRQAALATQRTIRRHALQKDPLAQGLLHRQCGMVEDDGGGSSWVYTGGRCRVYQSQDLGPLAWARGLTGKGSVGFSPTFAEEGVGDNMGVWWVGGMDETTRLGVAYATLDQQQLIGRYIATDSNQRVHFDRNASPASGRNVGYWPEMIRCPNITSIAYHEADHKMLITSHYRGGGVNLSVFSPPLSAMGQPAQPHWLLGRANHYAQIGNQFVGTPSLRSSCTPAPASSPLLCLLGTSKGLCPVTRGNNMTLGSLINVGAGETFAQEFSRANHNVVFVAGRKPKLWMGDLRTRGADFNQFRMPASVAHVRSLSEHHVLVAGLRDEMALYDLRSCRSSTSSTASQQQNQHQKQNNKGIAARTQAVVEFPDYRNHAHFNIGLDISFDLNTVASAQADGTIKLFSLKSGRRLSCPVLDGSATTAAASTTRHRANNTPASAMEGLGPHRGPVKKLCFEKMAGERMESLWVGVGGSVQKISFGTRTWDEAS